MSALSGHEATTRQAADALLARCARPWVPDWPVILPGCFVGYVGDVFIAMIGEGLDDDGYKTYVEQTRRSIVGSPDSARRVSVTHYTTSRWWAALSLSEKTARMRHFSQTLDPYQKKLAGISPAFAMVMASTAARAAVRTLFTIGRVSIPYRIGATAADAYRFVARYMPSLEGNLEVLVMAHLMIAERHLPGHLPSIGSLQARARVASEAPIERSP